MKKLNLFLTIFFVLPAILFIACSQDDLVGPTKTEVNTLKAIVTVSGDAIPNGGRAEVPKNRQIGFDGSTSSGAISQRWIIWHNGSIWYTDTNKSFLKMFTTAPDSFRVSYRVWNLITSDSTQFDLIIKDSIIVIGGPGEIALTSSNLLANGKRRNITQLPIGFIPNGSINSPHLYGDPPRLSWSGKSIPFDTLNRCFRWIDTSYDNGGFKMNYSGVLNGPWGNASLSTFKMPGSENLFWLDYRNGSLYPWGQQTLMPPGMLGDTGYVSAVIRYSFSTSSVTAFMNNRTGTARTDQVPTFQYSWNNGAYQSANQNILNSSGYGQATLDKPGNDSVMVLKIKIGYNVNMTTSICWVPSEQALVIVIIGVGDNRTVLPGPEALRRGYKLS